jgi:two-component system, NarL family, nitrate/nitrite response regulator NarL
MNELLLLVRAQLLREGLRKLLTDASFSVIGEASTPDDALKFIDLHQDQEIGLIVGEASICFETVGFLSSMRQAAPKARIIILANQEDMLRLGHRNIAAVDGVLSLQISAEVMAQSLRLMQLGERMVPTDLIMLLMGPEADAACNTSSPVAAAETLDARLLSGEQSPSRRETEILRHLVNGCSNKVIARQLGITEATVKVHLKGLLRKIRATNRTQAAIWALNNGISVPHFLPHNATSQDHSAIL